MDADVREADVVLNNARSDVEAPLPRMRRFDPRTRLLLEGSIVGTLLRFAAPKRARDVRPGRRRVHRDLFHREARHRCAGRRHPGVSGADADADDVGGRDGRTGSRPRSPARSAAVVERDRPVVRNRRKRFLPSLEPRPELGQPSWIARSDVRALVRSRGKHAGAAKRSVIGAGARRPRIVGFREGQASVAVVVIARGRQSGLPGKNTESYERNRWSKKPTGYGLNRNPLFFLVAGAGFEPATFGLGAQRATGLLHPAVT